MPARRFASSRPLSPFGTYLVALCQQRGITVTQIADALGGKARMSYALRGRSGPAGRGQVLDFHEIETLAKRLRCSGEERRRLILLGLLEHAPPELRSCVVSLIRQQRAFTDLDFSGKPQQLPEDF